MNLDIAATVASAVGHSPHELGWFKPPHYRKAWDQHCTTRHTQKHCCFLTCPQVHQDMWRVTIPFRRAETITTIDEVLHKKMQINAVGFITLSTLYHMWIGLSGNKWNFLFPGKHRRPNPNSPDQQHGTATISKSKLQALLHKPPHNGCSELPERGSTNKP